MNNNITLALPTFNRYKIIAKNLEYIVNKEITKYMDVIVLDNNSDDGTYIKLKKTYNQIQNLKLLQNKKNISFCGSFFRLIRECSTQYIFFCSDEDFLLLDNLSKLERFIEKNKFSFIVTEVINYENTYPKLYKDIRENNIITLKKIFFATDYISGIIFDVYKISYFLDKIEGMAKYNEFVLVYPQTALSMIASTHGLWFKYPMIQKTFDSSTNITRLDNKIYSNTEPQKRLKADFLEFIKYLDNSCILYNKDMLESQLKRKLVDVSDSDFLKTISNL